MTGTVYDAGATADAVFRVQAALVREWMAGEPRLPKRPTDDEYAVYVTRCSDALILPPGHVATVFNRIGHRAIGEAFLRVCLAAKKAAQKAKNPTQGEGMRRAEEERNEKVRRRKAATVKPG